MRKKGKEWSEQRIGLLEKYIAERKSYLEISELMGDVTKNAVGVKVRRLKLSRPKAFPRKSHRPLHSPIWPSERSDTLRRMWLRGCPVKEIAVRLGATKNAVIGRANRMGLPAHQGQPAEWTAAEDGVLRDMVAKGCTAKEISKELGRTAGAIARRKQFLNIVKRRAKRRNEDEMQGT